MISFDHYAITVKDLNESIIFYKKLGYKLMNRFSDEEYEWATLRLGNYSLELFENKKECMDHVAYNYDNFDEVIKVIEDLGYREEDLDIYYGDLNRESFFIEDINGKEIQFIKK